MHVVAPQCHVGWQDSMSSTNGWLCSATTSMALIIMHNRTSYNIEHLALVMPL
jgi:hypothetical protein